MKKGKLNHLLIGGLVMGWSCLAYGFYEVELIDLRTKPDYRYETTGLKIGPTRWHPYAYASWEYDDNIFLAPGSEHRKDDDIFRAKPGVRMNLPLSRHLFTAGYMSEFLIFAEFEDQNSVRQYASGELNLNNLGFLSLTAKDEFTDTNTRSETEFTERTKRSENTASVLGEFDFNKISVDVRYQHFLRTFEQDERKVFDHTSNSYAATGYVQLFPKLKGLAEYAFRDYHYERDPAREDQSHEVRGGFKGELTPKLLAWARLGWQKYDADEENPDSSEFVASTALGWNPWDGTSFDAGYERDHRQSTVNNNNYYLAERINLGWTEDLVEKLKLGVTTFYQFNSYPDTTSAAPRKRRDNLINARPKFTYSFSQYFSSSVAYEFLARISTIDSEDYHRHILYIDFNASL